MKPASISGITLDWCMPAGVIAPDSVAKTAWSCSTLARMSRFASRRPRPAYAGKNVSISARGDALPVIAGGSTGRTRGFFVRFGVAMGAQVLATSPLRDHERREAEPVRTLAGR